MLECVGDGVSPNAVEKGIHGMLDRISQNDNLQGSLINQIYEATLAVFSPKTGTSPNERVWFKTNIKYGQLMYEMNETAKLQHILKDLQSMKTDGDGDSIMGASSSSTTSTQHLELNMIPEREQKSPDENSSLASSATKDYGSTK
jgi:COP9 signalosome complex subunit 2